MITRFLSAAPTYFSAESENLAALLESLRRPQAIVRGGSARYTLTPAQIVVVTPPSGPGCKLSANSVISISNEKSRSESRVRLSLKTGYITGPGKGRAALPIDGHLFDFLLASRKRGKLNKAVSVEVLTELWITCVDEFVTNLSTHRAYFSVLGIESNTYEHKVVPDRVWNVAIDQTIRNIQQCTTTNGYFDWSLNKIYYNNVIYRNVRIKFNDSLFESDQKSNRISKNIF